MIWGLESSVDGFCSIVSQEAFARGLLMETAGARDQVLKFLAPLTITDAELNAGLAHLADAVAAAVERMAAVHAAKVAV